MASARANTRRTFRETFLDRFPDLDREFYDIGRDFFETRGFKYLGEIEDPDHNARNRNMNTCLRVLIGDGGAVRAAVYHFGTRSFTKLLKAVVPNMKFVSLETEFLDGAVLVTTNDFFSEPRKHVDLKVDAEMAAAELLELHTQRVADYRSKHPGCDVWKTATLGEVIEAYGRVAKQEKKLIPWNGKGFGGHVYKFRRVFGKILAIVVIGCLIGLFWRSNDMKRYRLGVELTRESYEAQYPSYVKRSQRLPRLDWIDYSAGLLLALILFGSFEAIGKGGGLLIGKLTSRYRDQFEEKPFSSDPEVMRRIRKSIVTGKILALLVIGLLIGAGLVKSSARANPGKPVSQERYMENYPQFKQKMTQPLADPVSYIGQTIFVMFLIMGLYELGGKTIEGGAMLYYCRKMDLESHLLLSVAWVVIGFFGSGILFLPLLLRELSEAPVLIKLPIAFGIVLGAVYLLNKLFDRIPVACSRCGERAYRTNRNPVSYKCRACKHVQRTNFSWGR